MQAHRDRPLDTVLCAPQPSAFPLESLKHWQVLNGAREALPNSALPDAGRVDGQVAQRAQHGDAVLQRQGIVVWGQGGAKTAEGLLTGPTLPLSVQRTPHQLDNHTTRMQRWHARAGPRLGLLWEQPRDVPECRSASSQGSPCCRRCPSSSPFSCTKGAGMQAGGRQPVRSQHASIHVSPCTTLGRQAFCTQSPACAGARRVADAAQHRSTPASEAHCAPACRPHTLMGLPARPPPPPHLPRPLHDAAPHAAAPPPL